mgnify:CR=1 FL=1
MHLHIHDNKMLNLYSQQRSLNEFGHYDRENNKQQKIDCILFNYIYSFLILNLTG